MRLGTRASAWLALTVQACAEPPVPITPIAAHIDLWDERGYAEASGHCREREAMWTEHSAADVSKTRGPGDEGVGGTCVIPVDGGHEGFVLEQVRCVDKREGEHARTTIQIDTLGQNATMVLTAEAPSPSLDFGRGWLTTHDVQIDAIGTTYAVACTVQGYYVYPLEPPDEDSPALRPFAPNVTIVERQPHAPK